MFYRPDLTSLGCLWYLTPKCNYHCPYCYDQEKTRPQLHYPREDCLRAWERLARQHGPLQIGFTGGEPSRHPLFFPLLRELSAAGHVLFVATNLSAPPTSFIEHVADPDLCYIHASLHLRATPVRPFYERVVRLQEAGFHVSCSGVLFPPLLSAVLAAKRFFERHRPEVFFGFQVFWGEYGGQRYPESYSAEERHLMATECGLDLPERVAQTEVPPGQLCRAGQDYFVIAVDGEILRCPSAAPLFHESFPHFSLSDRPLPCPLPQCLCPDLHGFRIPGEETS